MGKSQQRSGHGGGGKPYSRGGPSAKEAANKAVNKVFKMNTDLGQHILKNPGVAQAIVDKAGLKQSDVFARPNPLPPPFVTNDASRSCSRSGPEQGT